MGNDRKELVSPLPRWGQNSAAAGSFGFGELGRAGHRHGSQKPDIRRAVRSDDDCGFSTFIHRLRLSRPQHVLLPTKGLGFDVQN
ncbi:hypothetical protein EYF80_000779 [Liparis tanakae]|uniref:Uncharacterized protein n=1 Tax=Liparis tanakae TaxID=230148 RepID=A0A4Z2JFZ9_9TELE|nr:hypothetical protein EYF80_000779 [Liparis tanakae]